MCCRWLLPLLLMVFTASAVQAQTASDALRFSERAPATGARMIGMAGAGIAGYADYGMMYANPAGLGYFESSQAAGSFKTLLVQDDAFYQTGIAAATEEQQATDYRIGNAALIYKFPTSRGSLVFGGGYNAVNTFQRDLSFSGQSNASSVTDFFLPIGSEVSAEAIDVEPEELFFGQEIVEGPDGQRYLLDFDPDGNGAINRPLSFAAFQTFGIDFDSNFYEDNPDDPAAAFLPAVDFGTTILQEGDVTEEGGIQELNFSAAVQAAERVMFGLSLNAVFGSYAFRSVFSEDDVQNENDGTGGTTDLRTVSFEERFDSDLVGFGLRGGVSAKMNEYLRAGLTLETPTLYTIDETSETILRTSFDNGDAFAYGNQSGDVGRTEFEYRVQTPWRIGAGVQLEAANLSVMADAELVDWSQLELSDLDDSGVFEAENEFIRDEYSAVVNTRLGAEYQLSGVVLRAGFAYQPDPRDTELDRSRTFFSTGVGYQFDERLEVNVGLMQERFEDSYLPYELEGAFEAEEEIRRNQVVLGLSYSF